MTLDIKKNIETLSKKYILSVHISKWYSAKIFYVEFPDLCIAFDIVIGEENLFVDLVLRKNADKARIQSRYTGILEKEKQRILTIPKNKDFVGYIYSFIHNEYIELKKIIPQKLVELYYLTDDGRLEKNVPLKMYFFSNTPNFGDLVGPWLASKLTGRPVINVNKEKFSSNAIFGVGSIIHLINYHHQACKIWGSGLITDHNIDKTMKNLKEANISRIASVRGKLTGSYLKQYDFNFPDIYGDPGLVFSKLYEPNSIFLESKKIIIPHYTHYHFFNSLALDEYVIIDVRDGVTQVIDQIANADMVISTSMHGCILAQSYSIPWIHLHINDDMRLLGDLFKFNDFFTTLDRSRIPQVSIPKKEISRDFLNRILSKAYVPVYDKYYNPDDVISAFYECLD